MSTREPRGRIGRVFWLLAAVAMIMAAMPLAGAGANGSTTTSYPDQPLTGGFNAGHFDDVYDLTAGDMTLSFTYDGYGLVDDAGAHAWAELGVRSRDWGQDFNPYGTEYVYTPLTVDLFAGQDEFVGTVEVSGNSANLEVTYTLLDGWCMTESHLAVATELDLIPQTKKNNPIPGQFAYGDSYDPCVTTDAFTIPLADIPAYVGNTLYIAAHAVVRDTVSNIVYGIEFGSAELYEIDLAGCTATYAAQLANTTSSGSYPNSLAYDDVSGRLFYADGRTLYVYEAGVSTAVPGFSLPTNLADAAWHDDYYYFVTHDLGAVGQLYQVDVAFDASGPTGATATQVDAVGASIYGDIAIQPDGMLYGSNRVPGGDYTFFGVDLATPGSATVLGTTGVPYQLAFDGLGRLIGTATTTAAGVTAGVMHELSTADGTTIDTVCPTALGRYTDLSDGPGIVYRYETAWGAGDDFEGKNWATYITYEPDETLVEGSGVWLATDYRWGQDTLEPDPVGAVADGITCPTGPCLDNDDKMMLQRVGGQGEDAYDLPGTPPNQWANHAFWFDRDGVDQFQALMWGMIDGVTYNTGGVYDVVITLHADSATAGTAYMTVNGEDQGFYVPNWHAGPLVPGTDLYPAGMTFTGDMERLVVFYGLYGYGATHSVEFSNIEVTQ